MPRRIDARERRNRLAHRHRLAQRAKAGTVEEVAAALVALHATDPATVHLAAGARLTEPSVAAVERALYDDRTLLRMLGMRRTMFVVPRASVPVIQAACSWAIRAGDAERNIAPVDGPAPLIADLASFSEVSDPIHRQW